MVSRLMRAGFAALIWCCALFAPRAEAQALRGAAIEDLTQLRDIGGPYSELALSPDGATAVVIERRPNLGANDYDFVVVAIDVRSGRAREIGEAGRSVLRLDGGRASGVGILRRPQFSADGRFLLYLREHDGAVEIWRAAIDGAGSAPLIRMPGDVRRFRVVGEAVVFETSTPRDALTSALELGRRVGFSIDDRFAPSYSLAPLPDIDREVGQWRFDLASGENRPATPEEARALDLGPAPHVRPLDPSLRADEPPVGVFDTATGVRCADAICAGPITQSWDVNAPDGARLVLLRRQEGHARRLTSFYFWRPDTQEVRLFLRTEMRVDGCAPSPEALVCLVDSAFEPRRVVAFDWRQGRARTLYDPNPQWRAIAHPRIERFEYTDREGNESFANLIYPLGWRPGRVYPLVVSQYRSRGFLLGGTGDETPILPLSAAGYFVLDFDRPEFRARGQLMTMAALQREVELAGVERSAKREALDFFLARALARGADADRLAITGLSDGAETAYAMLIDEGRFAAAVISTPPTEPMSWALQSQQARETFFARTGLTGPWDDAPEPWRTWWRANAPIFHVDRIGAPILFNLADAEALRAFPLMTRLRERGAPFDAYLYPGAYHLKWRPLQIGAAQQRTMDWFDFWLRGIERADANEPDRLERWRALRSVATAAHPD